MRRLLLVTSALVGLGAGPASAQGFPVIDIAANLKMIQSAIHDAKDYVMQDLHLAQMIDTLREAQAFHAEVNAITNIHNVSSALGYVGTRVPLPTEVYDLVSLSQGVSTGGPLAGRVVRFLETNRVYTPTGNDLMARRIRQAATSNAGGMAMAEQVYSANATRLIGQDELQARLATARTQAEKNDLIARATIENGRALAQSNQLAAAAMLLEARREADRQALEQARRQSADELLAEAEAVIAAGGRRTNAGTQLVAAR